MGCISPYGAGVPLFWDQLQKGTPAFRPTTLFDTNGFRNDLVGQVPDNCTPAPGPRALQFLQGAAREASSEAGLSSLEPSKVGISLGTNFGSAQSGLEAIGSLPDSHCPLAPAALGAGINAVRLAIPSSGPAEVLSLACASGAAALGVGATMIRRGQADVVIAGGFDELSLHAYTGLNNLRAISKDGIRPFHAKRGGTLFAEGAGLLVLEEHSHALEREAPVLAFLEGWAVNNDAFHMTAPDKTGKGIAAVMNDALADARLRPEDVEHLNCHGTGTKYNDLIETTAIHSVFAEHAHRMILTANKSCFGHAMGAAGALEAISTVQSLRTGVIPPTLGLDEIDPALDLDYCPLKARFTTVTVAMSNSYGLGGTNASVVLSRTPTS
jgi:3-oxoacyl-(acyl-carrier-protein) synthase